MGSKILRKVRQSIASGPIAVAREAEHVGAIAVREAPAGEPAVARTVASR
jgi:hypothetical protein